MAIALSMESVVGDHKGWNDAVGFVEERKDIAGEEPLIIATVFQKETIRMTNVSSCGTEEVNGDTTIPWDELGIRGHGVILVRIGEEIVMDGQCLLRVQEPGHVLGVASQGIRVSICQALWADIAMREEVMDGIVSLDVRTDVVVDNVWEEEIALRG